MIRARALARGVRESVSHFLSIMWPLDVFDRHFLAYAYSTFLRNHWTTRCRYGILSHMIDYLTKTNPSGIWLKNRFAVSIPLANLQTIMVRFDLSSCDKDCQFTEQKVNKHFKRTILVDRSMTQEDYWSVCDALAWNLNQQMQGVAADAREAARMSIFILDALTARDYAVCLLLVEKLIWDLDAYKPLADEVWAEWLQNVVKHIKSGDDVGFSGNRLN